MVQRRLFWTIGGLVGGILLGVALIFGLQGLRFPFVGVALLGEASVPAVGSSAPLFELQTLSGQRLRLDDLLGRPTLLNFWASWCEPCRREIPLLHQTAEHYAGQLQVVMINDGESIETVRQFMANWQAGLTVVLDTEGEVNRAYAVQALPMTYFLDASGRIRAIHVGLLTDKWLNDALPKIGIEP